MSLSLEGELSSPTLDEDKNIMDFDQMPLVLEGELQDLSLVEKNELAIDEELLLKEKQVVKKHLELIVENVLVKVENVCYHGKISNTSRGIGKTSKWTIFKATPERHKE